MSNIRGIRIFTPVGNRELLSKTIASKIEEAIRSKKLVEGNRLPSEFHLCEQFGVSRTSLREALRMLSARGLISIVKGKGIFVTGFSAESVTLPFHRFLESQSELRYVMDVVHARQIIEPSIAAFAALHSTGEDIGRLEKDLKELRESTGDFTALAILDMNFHLDIAKATHNPLMPLILEPIQRLLPDIKSSVYATIAEAKDSAVTLHRKIFDAIARHDAGDAQEAMRQHLIIAEEHAEQMLKTQFTSIEPSLAGERLSGLAENV